MQKITWTNEFTLPKYNSLGQEINYTAGEKDLNNIYYTAQNSSISGNMQEGYIITNTFEVPNETVTMPVTKVWNDSNNKAQKRPESVTMVLTATSTTPEQIPEEYREIRQTLTDSNVNGTDANKWNYTFSNLPRYDDYGNEITYLLSEEKNRRNRRNILYSRKHRNNRKYDRRVYSNKHIRSTK